MQTIEVDPRKIARLPTQNPNVMEPHVFEALCGAISAHGFLQPILVVAEGAGYTLVDGVHRSEAAIKIGLPTIPAVVATDRKHAELLRIAMNKMRGELDMSEVSRQLQQLFDVGFNMAEVETTGFADWEIQAMLDVLANGEDDAALLDGADTVMPEPTKPKAYSLAFSFGSEVDRARAKAALESIGNGDLLTGLHAALDAAFPEWQED